MCVLLSVVRCVYCTKLVFLSLYFEAAVESTLGESGWHLVMRSMAIMPTACLGMSMSPLSGSMIILLYDYITVLLYSHIMLLYYYNIILLYCHIMLLCYYISIFLYYQKNMQGDMISIGFSHPRTIETSMPK